jgi:aspartyl-tRNA(Asn)/glutamyl-tRNA(Gln) amidotransferase subunit C
MADEITPELFNHLVELAALELEPQEGEYLRRQLNSQLRAVHLLERIPLPDEVPPAAHGVEYTPDLRPPLRDDVARAAGDDLPDRILAQAPELDDRYFVAPGTAHTEL